MESRHNSITSICGHVTLVWRFHDNLDVNKTLSADIGFDAFGDFVQIVFHRTSSELAVVTASAISRSLSRRRINGQSNARLDFVCRYFRHQNHPHMSELVA